jgi:TolB protein
MILTALISILMFSPFSTAQAAESGKSAKDLYINVGQAQVKKSLAAVAPIQFLGTPSLAKSYLKYEKEVQDVMEKDLTIASYFTLQNSSAFLENPPRGLRPHPIDGHGFLWDNWQSIGTEFLIKTGFDVIGDRFELQTYVYNVARHEQIFGRSYSGPLKDFRSATHKFCNDLLEQITGKKSFFLTKVVTGRSTDHRNKEIFVMDWDGANVEAITHSKSGSMSPSWSRDGRYLAYSSFAYHTKNKTRNNDLFLYDFITRKSRVLSFQRGINSTATFFPDDQNIIMRMSPNNGSADLYKMSLSSPGKTPLTNGPRGAMNVEPAMSPDGTKVAFSSDRSGKAMIYILDLQKNTTRRLTFAGFYNSTPSWSPDGKKIAFMGNVDGHFDIFTMDIDGKNMQRLTTARKPNGKGADNEDPSYSPDGRMIMFRSNRTGHYQIYVVTTDGKNEYRITFDNHNYYAPKWSPFLK